MQKLSFKLNHGDVQIYTCICNCRKAYTLTYLYTCPIVESPVLSSEWFSQSENGHKIAQYSDLTELFRNSNSHTHLKNVASPV